MADFSNITTSNSQFTKGSDSDTMEEQLWFTNLEEDLFRIPFGLGIIFRSPTTEVAGGTTAVGADYLENVSIQSRNVSLQSGQAFIMEQVSFLADRVVPWTSYTSGVSFGSTNPADEILG